MMGEGDDCAQTSSSDDGGGDNDDDDPYHNDRSSRITFRKGKRRREGRKGKKPTKKRLMSAESVFGRRKRERWSEGICKLALK